MIVPSRHRESKTFVVLPKLALMEPLCTRADNLGIMKNRVGKIHLILFGDIAQLVERCICNAKVTDSVSVISTII